MRQGISIKDKSDRLAQWTARSFDNQYGTTVSPIVGWSQFWCETPLCDRTELSTNNAFGKHLDLSQVQG